MWDNIKDGLMGAWNWLKGHVGLMGAVVVVGAIVLVTVCFVLG